MNDEQIRQTLRNLALAILDRVSQVEFDPLMAIAAVSETLKLCEAEVMERKPKSGVEQIASALA